MSPIFLNPGYHKLVVRTLVIGPEGGFIPYEIEKLIDCGFTAVQMGERILSVETAVPALLSRLY